MRATEYPIACADCGDSPTARTMRPARVRYRKPLDRGEQNERQIDQRVVREQQPADHRQRSQPGNDERLDRFDDNAHVVQTQERGQADAEERQRKTACDLVRHQRQRQHAEDQRQRGAGAGARDDTEPGRLCRGRDDERRDGAGEHHAFDAQVEHAGFFRDEFPERRVYQRRAGRKREYDELREMIHQ